MDTINDLIIGISALALPAFILLPFVILVSIITKLIARRKSVKYKREKKKPKASTIVLYVAYGLFMLYIIIYFATPLHTMASLRVSAIIPTIVFFLFFIYLILKVIEIVVRFKENSRYSYTSENNSTETEEKMSPKEYELLQFKEMLDEGLITADDYEKKKMAILGAEELK